MDSIRSLADSDLFILKKWHLGLLFFFIAWPCVFIILLMSGWEIDNNTFYYRSANNSVLVKKNETSSNPQASAGRVLTLEGLSYYLGVAAGIAAAIAFLFYLTLIYSDRLEYS